MTTSFNLNFRGNTWLRFCVRFIWEEIFIESRWMGILRSPYPWELFSWRRVSLSSYRCTCRPFHRLLYLNRLTVTEKFFVRVVGERAFTEIWIHHYVMRLTHNSNIIISSTPFIKKVRSWSDAFLIHQLHLWDFGECLKSFEIEFIHKWGIYKLIFSTKGFGGLRMADLSQIFATSIGSQRHRTIVKEKSFQPTLFSHTVETQPTSQWNPHNL